VQVDAIEKGPRETRLVRVHTLLGARAAPQRVAGIATGAWIGGGHDEWTSREGRTSSGASERDFAILERLPKGLESRPTKLENLVEKKDAVVRERDFPGANGVPAADQAGIADGVVRASERTRGNEPSIGGQEACDAVDHRDGERFVECEGRQERRKTAREHRLAPARRPDEQEVVTAGGSDLERSASGELAANVSEIGAGSAGLVERCRGSEVEDSLPRKVTANLIEIVREMRLDATRHAGFAPVVARDDGAEAPECASAGEVHQ
jgi:hypothetical protein